MTLQPTADYVEDWADFGLSASASCSCVMRIQRCAVTITVNEQSKIFGENDPDIAGGTRPVDIQLTDSEEFVYNGKPQQANVAAVYSSEALVNGEDYTLLYSNHVNAGDSAAVTVSGSGGGGGSTIIVQPPGPIISVDPDNSGVSKWLNTDDHSLFMIGRENGLFCPDAQVTRAEAAMVFYRLLRWQSDLPNWQMWIMFIPIMMLPRELGIMTMFCWQVITVG